MSGAGSAAVHLVCTIWSHVTKKSETWKKLASHTRPWRRAHSHLCHLSHTASPNQARVPTSPSPTYLWAATSLHNSGRSTRFMFCCSRFCRRSDSHSRSASLCAAALVVQSHAIDLSPTRTNDLHAAQTLLQTMSISCLTSNQIAAHLLHHT